MSVNRRGRNKGATKRAYLKSIQNKRSPKGGMVVTKRRDREDIGDFTKDPANAFHFAEPVRSRSWVYSIHGTTGDIQWDKTPRMSKPYAERTEKLRKAQAPPNTQREISYIELARTPFFVVRHCFDGYDTRAVHWIEKIHLFTNTVDKSITYSTKDSARNAVYSDTIKWKVTGVPYVGSK